MLGWINQSIEAFITSTFGAEKWQEVVAGAGVQPTWVSSCPYSDKVTYDLVVTAAGLLGVSVNDALEAYGQFFFQHVADQGYTKLMSVLGANLAEFLQNLNNLHLHLSYCWPDMVAPAFRCEQVTPESLLLHYNSMRPGLWAIVVGVLKGVSSQYFNMPLQIQLLHSRERGDSDHEVFQLRYPFQEDLRDWGDTTAAAECSMFSMSAPLFYTLHPFHLILDDKMQLLQWGPALGRAVAGLQVGQHVRTFFKCKHPGHVQLDYQQIRMHTNNTFVLQARNSVLALKGQMLPTSLQLPGVGPGAQPTPVLVYLASPRVRSLLEMQQSGIYLSDVPLHDMTSDYILLAEQRQAEADLKEKYERLTMDLQAANEQLARTTAYLEEEKARAEALLYRMSNLIACFPCGPGENPQQLAEMAECQSQAAQLVGGPANNSGSFGSSKPSSDTRHTSALDRIEAVRQELARSNIATEQNQVQCLELLGEGTYGKVYKGLWKGSTVAVKTIVLPSAMSGQEKREKMAIMEAAISSALSHPNIMQTYTYDIKPIKDNSRPPEQLMMIGGSATSSGGTRQVMTASEQSGNVHSYEVRLICEYCDRGSLREALDLGAFKLPDGSVNYPAVLDTAIEIATAVAHLHHRNVLHSDLKARNIMLKSSGSEGRGVTAKVADFGLAVKMDHMETHLSNAFQGTLTHMAPEIMIKGHISKATDTYSLGMVLYELYTSKHVFKGIPRALLGHQITVMHKRPEFPANAPEEFVSTTQACWDPNPANRPTLEVILQRLQAARAAVRCTTQPLASYNIEALLARKHGTSSAPRSTTKKASKAEKVRRDSNSGLVLSPGLREQELKRLAQQQQQRPRPEPQRLASTRSLGSYSPPRKHDNNKLRSVVSDVASLGGSAPGSCAGNSVATAASSGCMGVASAVVADETSSLFATPDCSVPLESSSSPTPALAGGATALSPGNSSGLMPKSAGWSDQGGPDHTAVGQGDSSDQDDGDDRSVYLEHSASTEGVGWPGGQLHGIRQAVRPAFEEEERSVYLEQSISTAGGDWRGVLHLQELSLDTMLTEDGPVPGVLEAQAAAAAAAALQQQQQQKQLSKGMGASGSGTSATRCPFAHGPGQGAPGGDGSANSNSKQQQHAK